MYRWHILLWHTANNCHENIWKHIANIIHLNLNSRKLPISRENINIYKNFKPHFSHSIINSSSRRHAIQIPWPVTNDGQIDASNLVAGHWAGGPSIASETSSHLLEDQGLRCGREMPSCLAGSPKAGDERSLEKPMEKPGLKLVF